MTPNDRVVAFRQTIIADILKERQRQIDYVVTRTGDDLAKAENDWIGLMVAFLGRAVRGCYRNDKENQGYRSNLIMVGALILAALEADIDEW